jgi:hypothetical protein
MQCPPFVTAVHAEPLSGLERTGVRLSDEALSEMRGKFVTPQSVSYFGIQMMTSWQGGDGITTTANLLFNVDFAKGAAGGGTPHLLISWSREGDPSMDVAGFGQNAAGSYVAIVGSGAPLPVSQIQGVDGVVQSNVISGADNGARNAMSIAIVPASAVPQLTPNGMQEVTGSVSQAFADGDKVDFTVDNGSVGLGMSSGQGPDFTRQLVVGAPGRIVQETVLNSSNNLVSNNTSILLGVDLSNQIDTVRVDGALSAMKLNGF